MLPTPALSVIIEYIGDTRMGEFINLAQVNRAWRIFFLSDYAWKRFDVHSIEGEHNIYTYGGYSLEGIAAHYFNWLLVQPAAQRAWHMQFSKLSCENFENTTELYDQLNGIGRVSELHKFDILDTLRALRKVVRTFDKRVWDCWLLHPIPETWVWYYLDLGCFAPLFGNKALFLRIACYLRPYSSPYYTELNHPLKDDREANMILLLRGHRILCPDSFLRDESFMLEAMSRSLKSAEYDWDFIPELSPKLLDKLYEQSPDMALGFIAQDHRRMKHFSTELQQSKAFVLQCVQYNPDCLLLAGKLRNDVALLRAAIEAHPRALEHAQKLRNSDEFVYLAVSLDPQALRWASRRLRDCTKLVKACTDRDPGVLKYATLRVQGYLRLQKVLNRR